MRVLHVQSVVILKSEYPHQNHIVFGFHPAKQVCAFGELCNRAVSALIFV